MVAILALATVLRLALAFVYVGFISGDDVEILETGLSPVTGITYTPWEIRNLLLPRLLVTPIGWLLGAVGSTDPTLLVRAATLGFVSLATLNGYLVYRAARWAAGPWPGVVAAGIYSFHWLPLGFGATVYPRTAATTCVLLAFLSLCGRGRGLRRGLAAGGLVALAFAFRYSEAIFLAPLILVPWLLPFDRDGRLQRSAGLVGGFLAGAVVTVGWVDLWTWGEPFASLVEFARYTLIEERASSLRPNQPPLWYLKRAPFWLIPTLLPFLFVRTRGVRSSVHWSMFLVPVVALSFIHHKEMRYLQGIVPFLAVLVAVGLTTAWARGWRKTTVTLLIASGLFSLDSAVDLHREKSLAAVRAACDLGMGGDAGIIVVTQAWAYGDRLFFPPESGIVNFETPPSAEPLRSALESADVAAFYEEDLRRAPELAAVLAEARFEPASRYDVAASRAVLVFQRHATRP